MSVSIATLQGDYYGALPIPAPLKEQFLGDRKIVIEDPRV